MEQFFITPQAEEGIKVELTAPDGRETGHWLKVLGSDSQTFRRAHATHQKKRVERLKDGKKLSAADQRTVEDKAERELVATLVADWSFDEPCTNDNVVAFFKKAPQIMEQVDLVAGQRANFSPVPLKNSDPMPEENFGLDEGSTAPTKQTAKA